MEAKIPVALGTDSTITGSDNLLEELRFARKSYREAHGEALSPSTLVSMVTETAADVVMAPKFLGRIVEGAAADVLVVEGTAACGGDYTPTSIQGREKWVVGDPDGLLAEIRTHVGAEKRFHFLPLDTA
ncbi:MAG: amidohydrolase family protein [Planctomycetota bacterium]|jgi:cytosine/adenosine deaminase-related metal-dependent hydrolase